VVGFSGGLLSAWGPNFKNVWIYVFVSGIVLDLEDLSLVASFRILNIYDLYVEKGLLGKIKQFWYPTGSQCNYHGDLNFTLSLKEVWESFPGRDPLEGFFSIGFLAHNLVELGAP
jgi:hypothetical protein